MDSSKARAIFHSHASAMAYVEVEDSKGDISIGSAFHIGDGVFLTARHIAERKILDIKQTEPISVRAEEVFRKHGLSDEITRDHDEALKERLGYYPHYKHWSQSLEISDGPFFPANDGVDLSVFKVKSIHKNSAHVKLGMHWDDWIYRGIWHLSDSIVLGYPPIPMSTSPLLIASKAQIHTYFIPR